MVCLLYGVRSCLLYSRPFQTYDNLSSFCVWLLVGTISTVTSLRSLFLFPDPRYFYWLSLCLPGSWLPTTESKEWVNTFDRQFCIFFFGSKFNSYQSGEHWSFCDESRGEFMKTNSASSIVMWHGSSCLTWSHSNPKHIWCWWIHITTLQPSWCSSGEQRLGFLPPSILWFILFLPSLLHSLSSFYKD